MTDDHILATLVQATESPHLIVRRGSFVGSFSNGAYPCCAVGAGILYAGIARDAFYEATACKVFAKKYRVSEAFAIGVSDGFEGFRVTCISFDGWESPAYARGWAVGAAVASSVES